MPSPEFPFRFDEDEILTQFRAFLHATPDDEIVEEFRDYLISTYGGHYNQKGGRQSIEDIMDLGFVKGFAGANIHKYLERFGHKDGTNVIDIFKIMHYCVFILYAHKKGLLK